MSSLRWMLAILTVGVLMLGATPVRAADGALPPLATLHSVREQTLLSFNGQPLRVCQREWQSWNRVHGVCRDLTTATVYDQRLVAGTVVEFVLFDGQRYERVNDQTSWTSTPDEGFAADVPLQEALFSIAEDTRITTIGPGEVAGVATMQYQAWVTDASANAAAGGQVVYDMFISADGLVRQSQVSVRGAVPGMGDGALTELRSYSDFNTPITIAPPT